jgi:hypothetical protein
MGNIFVSADGPSKIVSLINWQSVSILPAFLQEKWPVFLPPPTNYPEDLVKPKLPDDFENLNSDDKALCKMEYAQAMRAKAYELSTSLKNDSAFRAINIPLVFKELFTRCGEVAQLGVIPLRTCLIEILKNWTSLGFTGDCPCSFSDTEIKENELRFHDYSDWSKVVELATTCLDTDSDWWISPELDFEEKRRQNKELLGLFIERLAEEKTRRQQAR